MKPLPLAIAAFDASPQMLYVAHSPGWPGAFGLTPGMDCRGLSHYDLFPSIGPDASDPEQRYWFSCHERARRGERSSGTSETDLYGRHIAIDWGHEPHFIDGVLVGFYAWTIPSARLTDLIPAIAAVQLGVDSIDEVYRG